MDKPKRCKYHSLIRECEETVFPGMSIQPVSLKGEVYYTLVFKRNFAVESELFAERLNLLLDVIELLQFGHSKPNVPLVSGNSVQQCANFGVKKNTNTKNHVYS